MKNRSLLTEKKAILNTSIQESSISPLEEGEVLFKIDKYALTSNNVTYAVTGFQVKYWEFFPTDEPWGIVPVWGFATVVKSRHSEVKVGEKVYGYFPMSDYLKIKAGKVSNYSMVDVSAHRQELAAIYNTYNREGEKLDYPEGVEDFIPITKPLFVTSFLINEFLKIENYFNAENIIITSASSKTSLGLASNLANEAAKHGKNIIGLTSEKNVDFVRNTGFYNEVIEYKDINNSIKKVDSVIVDMAGNAELNISLYNQLGDGLTHLCKVGLTDWSKANMAMKIPVAKFFFAPTYAEAFFKKHGPAEANKMITEALYSFIKTANNWIKIEYLTSYADLQSEFTNMIKGKVDPGKGYIVKIGS